MGTLLKPLMHKLRPGRQKVELKPKQAKPFYLSQEWRALMITIRKQRGNQCHDPDHPPGIPRGRGRIYGDHIVELNDGGTALDPSNIMLRCPSCHQRKTAQQRIARYSSRPGGR